MNLLGFLAIVIAVTGLVWLLQMMLKGKDRIDINLSVGRSSLPMQEGASKPAGPTKTPASPIVDADSILGEVFSYGVPIPQPPPSSPNAAVLAGSSLPQQPEQQDAYLDLVDEPFEEFSNDSLLNEVSPGQLHPPIGQLAFSGFGSVTAQLPADSFEKPQSPQQIEAMFALLRESTQRIEQQMIALYEVHRSMIAGQHPAPASSLAGAESNAQVDSGDYEFGDDGDDSEESSFGEGLVAQLATMYPDDESQSAPATEFLTMDELGISVSDDAFQTYDASDALVTAPEARIEALPYFANLNKTGELSHDVVEAIKRKVPTREVKHRVRQVLRAIDYFNLSSDANAALRVTAVFSQLPKDLGEYDEDVAAIGRKFGLIEPDDNIQELEESTFV